MKPQHDGYLERALDRRLRSALDAIPGETETVLRKHSGAGFGGGAMIIALIAVHEDSLNRAGIAMVQAAFAADDLNKATAADVLRDWLTRLHRGLSDHLVQVFRRFGANDSGPLAEGAKFDGRADARIDELVDDFLHDVLQGKRMTKGDPFVAMMVNSPGGIQQVGHHNRQTVINPNRQELDAAIAAFLSSSEVTGLSPEQQVDLRDTAEILSEAVASSPPDEGKIKRWAGRFFGLARELGVQVAATGISKVLFG